MAKRLPLLARPPGPPLPMLLGISTMVKLALVADLKFSRMEACSYPTSGTILTLFKFPINFLVVPCFNLELLGFVHKLGHYRPVFNIDMSRHLNEASRRANFYCADYFCQFPIKVKKVRNFFSNLASFQVQ